MPRRIARVNELLRREISDLLALELRDPRLRPILLSITGVEVSRDLKNAKVYVSIMGDAQEKEEALRGLASAEGFFRRRLGQRLDFRSIPLLRFVLDESIEKADQLFRFLKEVNSSVGGQGDGHGSRHS